MADKKRKKTPEKEPPPPDAVPKLPEGYSIKEEDNYGKPLWVLRYGEYELVAKIEHRDPFMSLPERFEVCSLGDSYIYERDEQLHFRLSFPTLRGAVYSVITMRETILSRQIHPDAARYISDRVRDLNRDYEQAVERVRTLMWERRSLAKVAADVGVHTPSLPPDDETIVSLKELLARNNGELFDALGKEDYRSLKVLIRCLLEEIDPAAAATFEEL